MPMKLSSIFLILLAILGTGCDFHVEELTIPTTTPMLITATLPALSTSTPSQTPLPPPPPPTVAPVEGVTTTQINVRAEPSTAGNVLGIIPPNTKVEITGKDPGGNWWQINYPQEQAPGGKGWVTVQYVTAAAGSEVPTIGNETNSTDGNMAVVAQQINVRSGPGTDFNSLGTLNAQDVVNLTGKDPNGVWLQIEFAAGPEGKGWINAAFLQAPGLDLSGLPIITEAGQVVGTGTPTGIPFTPTATIMPAWEDEDSAAAPIVSVIFEPSGTQALFYNGNISFPQGDAEDWIAFKPYTRFVFMQLECQGATSIKIELTEDALPMDKPIRCGDPMQRVQVKAGSNYLLHLEALAATDGIQYLDYSLTVKTLP